MGAFGFGFGVDVFPQGRAFDPLTLSPDLWLKADAGTYQSDGGSAATADADPVGQWQDQSGNAAHWAEATNKPLLKLNITNSRPVIRFDGTNDLLTAGDFMTGATAAEIFIVLKVATDPPGDGAQTGLWDFSGGNNTHFPWTSGTIYDTFGSSAQNQTVDPSTTLAQFNVYQVAAAANSWTNWLNGTQLFTTGSNTVTWTTAPTLGKGAGAVFLQGDVGEILLWKSNLSAGNRTSVLSYLRSRWGTP